jgi:glucose/arabinose dehydrogenase
MNAATLALSVLAVIACCLSQACSDARRVLVEQFSGSYEAEPDSTPPLPVFDGRDAAREQIPIRLTPVAKGLRRPTDIQFDPSRPSLMIVLEQEGAIRWFDLNTDSSGILARFEVLSVSEQGLLGLAFHPRFPDSPYVYIHMTVRSGEIDVSRVQELTLAPSTDLTKARIVRERAILDVEQPYQNHNAGQLAFGPDGFLYIGWGDGGWAGDPHNHGQDLTTMLGSMLRIDVRPEGGRPYRIPADNPFIDSAGIPPETWAYGFRNPWRYSFDEAGRLIVADVGQNSWEEIDIVASGLNYGWNIMEGRHCYHPSSDCDTQGLTLPVYEYDHHEGQSITGGYVYLADDIPSLRGLYVFGDFVSGRLWALRLPSPEGAYAEAPVALGRWPIMISTFGRDPEGRVYLAGFGQGTIHRITPVP